jgi:PAS domain S-box-containing protein
MNPTILVVDDDPFIRDVFKTHLAGEGYEVVTAASYESALNIISKISLDTIILDVYLIDRSGVDILRTVSDRKIVCPIIMVTGKPDYETAAELFRTGAFDFLVKPVNKSALLRSTRNALRHKTVLEEKFQLQTENERYRSHLEAIFSSLQEAVITVDTSMKVIEVNDATTAICDFSPGEILNRGFGEIQTDCKKACVKVLEETLESKSTIKEFRVECQHPDRANQVVVLTGSPLLNVDGEFGGAVLVVRDVTRLSVLERELEERHHFYRIIGKSSYMQGIYRMIEDLAETETSVLITGESGTGKELVADALHYNSIRGSKPFVKVNCGALAENLLESELFGHVKGAFTGAIKSRTGRFQMADGGTIFLDEIGDISPIIQLKLLRFLQEREFERVGDSVSLKVDVRVVAATNRDLLEKVRLGEFREDLYYRLKVVELALPPLRERREDIPLLVDYFIERFNKRMKRNIEGPSGEVLDTFMQYPWIGNIRELEHAIEHAFVVCHESTLALQHLPPEIRENTEVGVKGNASRKQKVDDPRQILDALNRAYWNKAKAARILGISRPTLYQKIKAYKLTKPPA